LSDRIAALEAEIAGADMIVPGHAGQPVALPLLGEIRLDPALLAPTLGRLRADLYETSSRGRGPKPRTTPAHRRLTHVTASVDLHTVGIKAKVCGVTVRLKITISVEVAKSLLIVFVTCADFSYILLP
jgi:hypothetical protein